MYSLSILYYFSSEQHRPLRREKVKAWVSVIEISGIIEIGACTESQVINCLVGRQSRVDRNAKKAYHLIGLIKEVSGFFLDGIRSCLTIG